MLLCFINLLPTVIVKTIYKVLILPFLYFETLYHLDFITPMDLKHFTPILNDSHCKFIYFVQL